MFEVDKLMLPGTSGSAIVNVATNRVIGYAHAYRSFQIPSKTRVTEDVRIIPGLFSVKTNREVLTTNTLSLAVDLRNAEGYLKELGYVSK